MIVALGLAMVGQVFVILGALGVLNRWTITAVLAAALVAGASRLRRLDAIAMLAVAPLSLLALYPPIAFDETLYHLPFVQRIARSGAIAFQPDLRFPIFPQLHEALCVPAFLLAGDVATHLVATLELMALVALLVAWPRTRTAGVLAAALVLGNPIVLHYAMVTYVDIALALFIAAGFFCLDRDDIAAAGLFLGTACSVKFLGWYFAAAGALFVLLFARRRLAIFALAFLAAVLPMYATIVAFTGNPLFPFLGSSQWAIPMSEPASIARLLWDITFARHRVNQQPPYSPLFALSMLVIFVAALRDRRAAFLSATCLGYIAIFAFLPQDSRYLLPLLPLVSVAAANAIAPARKLAIALSIVSICAGIAYTAYRLTRLGPLPTTAAQRVEFLRRQIPEYRALEHRGPGRIYVCGAEQLKSFGGEELLGDVVGPWTIDKVNLATFRYVLTSKRACPPEWQRLPFDRIYEDEAAMLWRVPIASR